MPKLLDYLAGRLSRAYIEYSALPSLLASSSDRSYFSTELGIESYPFELSDFSGQKRYVEFSDETGNRKLENPRRLIRHRKENNISFICTHANTQFYI